MGDRTIARIERIVICIFFVGVACGLFAGWHARPSIVAPDYWIRMIPVAIMSWLFNSVIGMGGLFGYTYAASDGSDRISTPEFHAFSTLGAYSFGVGLVAATQSIVTGAIGAGIVFALFYLQYAIDSRFCKQEHAKVHNIREVLEQITGACGILAIVIILLDKGWNAIFGASIAAHLCIGIVALVFLCTIIFKIFHPRSGNSWDRIEVVVYKALWAGLIMGLTGSLINFEHIASTHDWVTIPKYSFLAGFILMLVHHVFHGFAPAEKLRRA